MDKPFVDSIVEAAQTTATNLCGKTRIGELMALLKKSQLFIGVDSGPMHIAAALKIPILALFGLPNTGRWAPRQANQIFLRMNNAQLSDVTSKLSHFEPLFQSSSSSSSLR